MVSHEEVLKITRNKSFKLFHVQKENMELKETVLRWCQENVKSDPDKTCLVKAYSPASF